MAGQPKRGEFTGKHMLAVFVAGFGVVIAVNLFMAYQAVGGFHGTVVENSYVASQNYNRWLAQAERSRALGWAVRPAHGVDGRVVLETTGVPADAVIIAQAERALGERETTALRFAAAGKDRWVSHATLAPGRWQLRMAITANGEQWAGDSELR